ncbi:MAG: sulfatase-like hydrolase/transferase [Pirellulaceae bacterium]
MAKWKTTKPTELVVDGKKLTGKELTKWKYQRYMQDYLACVQGVDDGVGKILDYLDESDLADNTIVIYSADNGWYLGDLGMYDKRFMYEPGLRVPLLARGPASRQAVLLRSLLPTSTSLPHSWTWLACRFPIRCKGVRSHRCYTVKRPTRGEIPFTTAITTTRASQHALTMG